MFSDGGLWGVLWVLVLVVGGTGVGSLWLSDLLVPGVLLCW